MQGPSYESLDSCISLLELEASLLELDSSLLELTFSLELDSASLELDSSELLLSTGISSSRNVAVYTAAPLTATISESQDSKK